MGLAPLEAGLASLRAGRWFEAHEELEVAWRAAEADERDFLQGLVHVAVAWYQAGRGRRVGCERQLEKAARRLRPYGPAHAGLDVESLLEQVEAAQVRVAGGSLELEPVRLRERLVTGRLLGEPLSLAHLDELRRLHTDPRVMATLGGVAPEERTRAWLDRVIEHRREHGFGVHALRDRQSGAFVGYAGLLRTTATSFDEVEVLYAFVARRWGEGLATECATALVELGLTRLDLEEIVGFTWRENLASQRVLQKAGFVFEREFEHRGLPHVLYRRYRP